MTDITARYWLLVAARDHVLRGVEGGFCQANHGKPGNLRRMRPGDGVVFYSGKETLAGRKPLQAFTAIGRVADGVLYQVPVSPGFEPFRRRVSFVQSHDVLIAPLLEALSFIPDKTNWGLTFRFGFLEIPEADFIRIATHMTSSGLV